MKRINVNDNVRFQKKTINDNVNDRDERRPADPKGFLARHDKRNLARMVDHNADKLVRETGNSGGRAFYCKALYRLGIPRVFELWEIAQKRSKPPGSPAKLFTFLLKKDGV